MTLALDISHFTHEHSGPLTKQQLEDAWNEGVRKFRPSIANQFIAVQQIDAIVDSGIPFSIETYRYYYFGMGTSAAQADKAFIQRVRNLKYDIQFHSIDIEDTNPNFTVQERIDITWQLIKEFEGFCPTDLYTAQWYWIQYMANTTEFSFMPLWYAWWPKIPVGTLLIPISFGGWTKARMHQYIGDTSFAGIWCDVNYYEDETAPAPPIAISPPIVMDGVYTDVVYDDQGRAIEIKNRIVHKD